MENLMIIGISFVMVAVVVVLLWGITLYSNFRIKKLFDANDEIAEKNNLALAFRRAGIILGFSFAFSGILDSEAFNIDNILTVVRDISLVTIFIFIAFKITDKIILSGANNDEEIEKHNISVGIVEFGILVATGLIALGSFSGSGVWYSSIVYFVLGQAILVLLVKGYSKFILKLNTIENNISVAVLISSIVISLGIILEASIEGPFVSWGEDLSSFAIWSFFGISLLVIFANKVVDKLFLPTTTIKQEIEDENYAAMCIVGAVKISIAIIIAHVII